MINKNNESTICLTIMIFILIILFIEENPNFFRDNYQEFVQRKESLEEEKCIHEIESSVEKKLEEHANLFKENLFNNIDIELLNKSIVDVIAYRVDPGKTFYSKRYDDTIVGYGERYEESNIYKLKVRVKNKSNYDMYINLHENYEGGSTMMDLSRGGGYDNYFDINDYTELVCKNGESTMNLKVADVNTLFESYINLDKKTSTIKFDFKGDTITVPLKSQFKVSIDNLQDGNTLGNIEEKYKAVVLYVDGEDLKKALSGKINDKYDLNTITHIEYNASELK